MASMPTSSLSAISNRKSSLPAEAAGFAVDKERSKPRRRNGDGRRLPCGNEVILVERATQLETVNRRVLGAVHFGGPPAHRLRGMPTLHTAPTKAVPPAVLTEVRTLLNRRLRRQVHRRRLGPCTRRNACLGHGVGSCRLSRDRSSNAPSCVRE